MNLGQTLPRLLAGPPLDGTAERLHAHEARLGVLPRGGGVDAIAALEASGLLGRGGAGFPVGRKWRAVAERRDRRPAVVVANGAEGEVASHKDRVLMAHRPHLVIDGALLAAGAVGADEIVLYIGGEHGAATSAMRRALMERGGGDPPIRLVTAPVSYVAGEATAAVHRINTGDARPTTTPPRVSQHGVDGRPTLVQNVESLAYVALIARFGDHWYRSAGRLASPGTALVTVAGAARRPGVREIELGTTILELGATADVPGDVRAILLGGYFGTWVRAGDAWELPLDPATLKVSGLAFGCGIVAFLPAATCGVTMTARLMGYMAGESAGQCGPCVYGLRAIADAASRVAAGAGGTTDLDDIERWSALVTGRGACHHPDGAAQLVTSALEVFADEFVRHARHRRCSATGARLDVA